MHPQTRSVKSPLGHLHCQQQQQQQQLMDGHPMPNFTKMQTSPNLSKSVASWISVRCFSPLTPPLILFLFLSRKDLGRQQTYKLIIPHQTAINSAKSLSRTIFPLTLSAATPHLHYSRFTRRMRLWLLRCNISVERLLRFPISFGCDMWRNENGNWRVRDGNRVVVVRFFARRSFWIRCWCW